MVKTNIVNNLDGRNAYNKGLTIWIKRGIPAIAAVWAQEYFEIFYRLKHLFGFLFMRTKTERESELQSHEIETQVAVKYYEAIEAAYRLKEAKGMVGGYDLFKGMTVKSVEKAMKDRKPAALEWISQNRKAIEDFKTHAERD
jgi:hypothetical protein